MTNNYKQSGCSLFAELNINFDSVSLEHLSHYTAVEYFLTEHDQAPAGASNSEKAKRYIESIHHLNEVGDEARAKKVLAVMSDEFPEERLQLTMAD
ncbi:MAG: hypothetical protein QNJ60_15020 [Xenococcaceae cyanobacterium MO_188.B19]|nr:hypothetical protein [Xenococcaceae cyanobacterium MO_188.B19]